ncbi:MAG: hypothetical protein KDJ16_13020 [Hyphomicrobiales bacterium]|nr:hypothetical protein [Hyphomicrobiales bacterium]
MRSNRPEKPDTGTTAGDGLARAFAGWLIAFALIVLTSLAVMDRPLTPRPILPVKAETIVGKEKIGLPRAGYDSVVPFARVGGGDVVSR